MKKNYLFITLLVLTTSIFSQSTIYVNSSTGNDTTGTGTIGSPYQTFYKGYTIAVSGDIIDLNGTFTWTDTGELGDVADRGFILNKDLLIQGAGPGVTIIQADASPNTADRRVFEIADYKRVYFKDLTIRHGRGFSGWVGTTHVTFHGGAIGSVYGSSNNVNLTLENVIISDNYSSTSGTGGVYCEGTFNANNCTFQNNTVGAGGYMALELYEGNTANHEQRNVINCVFYNNTSSSSTSPAVFIDRKGANIMNCTFIDNTNGLEAYALYNNSDELYITNCILANSAGYDLYAYSGGDNGVKVTNSIVESVNSSSVVISYTNSLTGNQTNLDVVTPATNGGNTSLSDYIEITSTSVAVDSGVFGNFGSTYSGGIIGVPSTDMRNYSRSGTTDIGSFEYAGSVLGTDSFELHQLGLFPNPASNNLIVDVDIESNFEIYNILGEKVKNGKLKPNKNTINLTGLSKGVFILKLINKNFEASKRFVIK